MLNDDDQINEIYTIRIQRNGTEFSAVEFNIPTDGLGRKMVSVMLANIAWHIDPANNPDLPDIKRGS